MQLCASKAEPVPFPFIVFLGHWYGASLLSPSLSQAPESGPGPSTSPSHSWHAGIRF